MRSHKKIQWSAFLAGVSVMATAGFTFAQDRYEYWSDMVSDGCYQEGPTDVGDYHIVKTPAVGFCSHWGLCHGDSYENNLVMAIHGGTVEDWTDEIAFEVAWYNWICQEYLDCGVQSSLYELKVHVQPGTCPFTKDDDDLHITATKYNEPQALDMAEDAYSIVSIHGLDDNSYDGADDMVICVGGQNEEMRDDFISQVNSDPLLSAFLTAEDATLPSCENNPNVPCTYCSQDARGIHDLNIVNRSLTNPNGGLQLEMTELVRDALFAKDGNDVEINAAERYRLIEIIQEAMNNESLEAP